MKLLSLYVENFRNIEDIQLAVENELTLITGQNGQGKTSLLEAIWMLTGGKSFRGGKDLELVRQGKELGRVSGNVQGFSRPEEIEVTVYGEYSPKKGRFARVNGVDYGRASEIAGHFTAVVFYPDHLRLVKGSPEGRRKFIDAALCQLYPGYLSILRRYGRALAQKNALLKQYHKTPDADALLDAFDAELAADGFEMIRRRKEFTEKTGKIAEKYYEEITNHTETGIFTYSPCCVQEQLSAYIYEARPRDIRAGFATAGPHREDLEITINEKPARAFASQGQQRSAVLCLKLAEAAYMAEVTKEHPVMLLDDVLSELDETRKEYLLYKMGGMQSFITSCTNEAGQKTKGEILRIKAGKIDNQG